MSDFDWNKMNPAAMWRDWVIKSEGQWSEAVTKMMKDNGIGGSMMTRQLDEARMMHRMFSEMAQATLAGANLPSRTDFEALDERIGRIEDGLAGVSAALLQLREALVTQGAAKPLRNKPTRDRRPSAGK